MKMEIRPNSEQCCVAERRLVDVEEGVAHRQVGQNHEIDLADQLPLFVRVDRLMDLGRRPEQCHCGIAITCLGDLELVVLGILGVLFVADIPFDAVFRLLMVRRSTR